MFRRQEQVVVAIILDATGLNYFMLLTAALIR